MSATTAQHTAAKPSAIRLGFARLVRSEWIKLWSIRSTWWCFAVIALLIIGMATLLGAAFDGPTLDSGEPLPAEVANSSFVTINTIGVAFAALVVAVIGVLIITGEYGTGQVRSTFTADPGRTGAILAKATVLAIATFLVSVVAVWIGVAIAAAEQSAKGVHPEIGDPSVFLPLLGISVYLTLLALLAFGIGLLVRSSAGGIAITLGLLLVLPGVLMLAGNLIHADWLIDVARFLPSEAGTQLHTFASTDTVPSSGVVLNGWGAFGVLVAEVVVVGALALTAARRRDV